MNSNEIAKWNWTTPANMNIARKNDGWKLEDEFSFWDGPFSRAMFNFRGVFSKLGGEKMMNIPAAPTCGDGLCVRHSGC